MTDKPENPLELTDEDEGWCMDCGAPWEQCDCTFLAFECGMLADGTCLKAGSEECDWECPRNG